MQILKLLSAVMMFLWDAAASDESGASDEDGLLFDLPPRVSDDQLADLIGEEYTVDEDWTGDMDPTGFPVVVSNGQSPELAIAAVRGNHYVLPHPDLNQLIKLQQSLVTIEEQVRRLQALDLSSLARDGSSSGASDVSGSGASDGAVPASGSSGASAISGMDMSALLTLMNSVMDGLAGVTGSTASALGVTTSSTTPAPLQNVVKGFAALFESIQNFHQVGNVLLPALIAASNAAAGQGANAAGSAVSAAGSAANAAVSGSNLIPLY